MKSKRTLIIVIDKLVSGMVKTKVVEANKDLFLMLSKEEKSLVEHTLKTNDYFKPGLKNNKKGILELEQRLKVNIDIEPILNSSSYVVIESYLTLGYKNYTALVEFLKEYTPVGRTAYRRLLFMTRTYTHAKHINKDKE